MTIKVVRDEPHAWIVECEGNNCIRTVAQAKRQGIPTDPTNPNSPVVWVDVSGPRRSWCVSCGAAYFLAK